MIEKLRRIVESFGYPFFFGTRDEVYAYINSVQTVVACYRQGGGGRQQFFVFKFKGDKPQRMYEEVMREIKRQFTVGVQRVFFYDDVLEARFPLMAKTYTEGGARPTPPPPPVGNNYMYFEAAEANSTVSLMSMLETAPNLEYSTDGVNFQEWEHTTSEGTHTFDTLTLGAIGDKVYLRGNNETLGYVDELQQTYLLSFFVMSGSINAGGSVTSLLDNDGISLTELQDAALAALFMNVLTQEPNTALLTSPSLGNVTRINAYSCMNMFTSCFNLVSPMQMDKVVYVGFGGCMSLYSECSSLLSSADMPNLESAGPVAFFCCYYHCSSNSSPANIDKLKTADLNCFTRMYVACDLSYASDMGSLETIGSQAFESMYVLNDNLTLLDNGNLTFEFPTLPIAYGQQTTLSTPQDVVDTMLLPF